jgi:protein ImuA
METPDASLGDWPAGRRARLAALTRQVRQIERGGALDKARVLPLGLSALDEALPGGGLPIAGLHEVLPARAEWDDGATTGFLTALLVRLLAWQRAQAADSRGGDEAAAVAARPLLWVGPYEDLYGPGLAAAGLPPERVLRLQARKDEEVLWALEEALSCPDLLAVVGELSALDRVAARRLQLAAEAAGKACFLLRRPRLAHRQPDGASAAVSRWRVTATPRADRAQAQSAAAAIGTTAVTAVTGATGATAATGDLGLGRTCWQVDLLRCRAAQPATFFLEWDHETGHLDLAAEFLAGTAPRRPEVPGGAGTAGTAEAQRKPGESRESGESGKPGYREYPEQAWRLPRPQTAERPIRGGAPLYA